VITVERNVSVASSLSDEQKIAVLSRDSSDEKMYHLVHVSLELCWLQAVAVTMHCT